MGVKIRVSVGGGVKVGGQDQGHGWGSKVGEGSRSGRVKGGGSWSGCRGGVRGQLGLVGEV